MFEIFNYLNFICFIVRLTALKGVFYWHPSQVFLVSLFLIIDYTIFVILSYCRYHQYATVLWPPKSVLYQISCILSHDKLIVSVSFCFTLYIRTYYNLFGCPILIDPCYNLFGPIWETSSIQTFSTKGWVYSGDLNSDIWLMQTYT